MADPTCRCDRPIHDTAYVCPACAAQLRRHLADVERIAGDITLTVAKLGKVRHHPAIEVEHEWYRGPGALYPMPLPVDLDAAARHDAAVGELTTWARHVAEERGHQIARGGHPLADAATYLSGALDWLRYRPEAPEAWPVLLSACLTLQRIVDTAAGEVIVGRCDCGRWLYAPEKADTVRCWGCAVSYDVASSRQALRVDLESRRMTGAEIATMAGYLGIADRTKARLMIKVWAQRGKLNGTRRWTANRTEVLDSEPIYRFGDAVPLLMVAYAQAA